MAGTVKSPGKLTCALVALCALWLAGAYPATAQEAWDQEKVKVLSKDLEKAVADLYKEARIEYHSGRTMTQSADMYLVVEDIQSLRRMARRLSRYLGEGQGKEETERLFERLINLVHRIRDARGRVELLTTSGDEIAAARAILEQLAAFYGVEVPAPPPVAAQPPEPSQAPNAPELVDP